MPTKMPNLSHKSPPVKVQFNRIASPEPTRPMAWSWSESVDRVGVKATTCGDGFEGFGDRGFKRVAQVVRRLQCQPPGVQHEPGDAALEICIAVQRVACDRVADAVEVYADLVLSSTARLGLDERERWAPR